MLLSSRRQKSQHDQHARDRTVPNLCPGDKWVPGVVLKQLGPVSYLIDVGEGKAWKRHVDHLKLRDLPEPEGPQVVENAGTSNAAAVMSDTSCPVTGPAPDPDTAETSSPSRVDVDIAIPTLSASDSDVTQPTVGSSPSPATMTSHYPTRVRQPPDYWHEHM